MRDLAGLVQFEHRDYGQGDSDAFVSLLEHLLRDRDVSVGDGPNASLTRTRRR